MKSMMTMALLLGSVAMAQPGERGPSVLWVDGPLYSWNANQRSEINKKLARVSEILDDAMKATRNDKNARRALRDADDVIGGVRELLAENGRAQFIRGDDERRGGKGRVRGVKTPQVAVLPVAEVDGDLLDADTSIAEAEEYVAQMPRVARPLAEARGLLREIHDTLVRTVGRDDPMPPIAGNPGGPAYPNPQRPGYGNPPPPPPQAQTPPMTAQVREAFFRSLDRESGGDNRLRIVEEAARNHYFLVADLEQVITRFQRPAMKLRALHLARARIIDPANAFQLYNAFPASRDKEELKRILSANAPTFTLEAMNQEQFRMLLKRVGDAYRDEDALADLTNESGRSYFNADQVAALVGTFNSSLVKLKAVQVLAPSVLDPENYSVIQSKFTSSHDRAAVREHLMSMR